VPGCGTSSADVEVVVGTAPPVAANAGIDSAACAADFIQLRGNVPPNGIGTWSQVSGPSTASFTNANDPNAVAIGLTDGVYTFRWTVTVPGCGSRTDDVTHTIRTTPPPVANAGPDATFCGVTSLTLQGTLPSGATGTWTVVSGPNTPQLQNPTSPNAVMTGLASGTYVLNWNVAVPGCPAGTDDQVEFTVDINPTDANPGPDQRLCATTTFTLTATEPAGVPGSWAQVSGPATATILSPNQAQTVVTNASALGDYEFEWRLAVPAPCAASAGTVRISIDPEPSVAEAQLVSNRCFGEPVTLRSTQPAIGAGQWVQTDGPTADLGDASRTTLPLSPSLAAGDYTFVWRVSTPACSPSDFEVSFTVHPQLSATAGAANLVLCPNTDNTLTLGGAPTARGGTEPFFYFWTLDPPQLIPAVANPSVTLSGPTMVFLEVQDAQGCVAFDTLFIDIATDTASAVFTVADTTGFTGFVPQVVNLSSNAVRYEWFLGDSLISTAAVPSFTLTVPDTVELVLVAYGPLGCPDTARQTLILLPDELKVFVPTAFSPDGNFQNDVFEIKGTWKRYDVKVFNRWGAVVFEGDSENPAWNGIDKDGNPCPEGVYVYYIEAESPRGRVQIEKGTVTLMR
jgi:gliding motility-associated-like protein